MKGLRDEDLARRVNRKGRERGIDFDNFLTNEKIDEARKVNNKKSKKMDMRVKDMLDENCVRVV